MVFFVGIHAGTQHPKVLKSLNRMFIKGEKRWTLLSPLFSLSRIYDSKVHDSPQLTFPWSLIHVQVPSLWSLIVSFGSFPSPSLITNIKFSVVAPSPVLSSVWIPCRERVSTRQRRAENSWKLQSRALVSAIKGQRRLGPSLCAGLKLDRMPMDAATTWQQGRHEGL